MAGALTKSPKECVPNHPRILAERRKKVYRVTSRTKDGFKKRPTVEPWWNTRFP